MLPDSLRELAAGEPSTERFRQLCAQLDTHGDAAHTWVSLLEELLSAWPAASREAPPEWGRRVLASGQTSPLLQLVRVLEISVHPGQASFPRSLMAALERTTDLMALQALTLSFLTIDDPPLLARLARCEGFPALQRFTLWGAYLHDEVAVVLAEAPWLSGLTELNLGWNQLTGEHLKRLLTSPHLGPGLTELWLGNNRLGPEGMEALAAATRLTALDDLTLFDNALGAEGAAVLAAIPHLASVQKLWLDSTWIEDTGAAALAGSPHLTRLTHLSVPRCAIGDAGAMALARSPLTEGLTFCDLSGNDLSEATRQALQQLPRFADTRLQV